MVLIYQNIGHIILIVELALRLFIGPVKPAKTITAGEFKSLIEQG